MSDLKIIAKVAAHDHTSDVVEILEKATKELVEIVKGSLGVTPQVLPVKAENITKLQAESAKKGLDDKGFKSMVNIMTKGKKLFINLAVNSSLTKVHYQFRVTPGSSGVNDTLPMNHNIPGRLREELLRVIETDAK